MYKCYTIKNTIITTFIHLVFEKCKMYKCNKIQLKIIKIMIIIIHFFLIKRFSKQGYKVLYTTKKNSR